MYESKSLVALVKAYGRHQYTLGQLSMINTPTGEASSNLKDLAEIHEGRDYPFRDIAINERQLSKDILSDIFHHDAFCEEMLKIMADVEDRVTS